MSTSSSIDVRLPPIDEIARRWNDIEPLLKKATDRTIGYEPIDILQLCVAGQMAVWLAGDILAVAVTQIRQFPRARVLEVPFIGSVPHTMHLWAAPLLDALDKYKQAGNCAAIMGFDRKGWSRFGFTVTGVVMERR